MVRVCPVVERAAERHRRLDAQVVHLLEPAHAATPWDEAVELRVLGVDLKLVIRRLLGRGLEEDLEDVVVPDLAVVFGDVGVEVGVVEVGAYIKVLTIPEDLRAGGLRSGLVVLAEPGHGEVLDRGGIVPGRVVGRAIDGDRIFSECALVGLGGDGRRQRLRGSGGGRRGLRDIPRGRGRAATERGEHGHHEAGDQQLADVAVAGKSGGGGARSGNGGHWIGLERDGDSVTTAGIS